MDILLYQVLCKKSRRKMILCHWHSADTQPMEGESFDKVVANFFDAILYLPLKVSLHHDHINLFEKPILPIQYAWLEDHEKTTIKEMVSKRREYFESCELYTSGSFSLRRYKKNVEWRIEHRRELLRDFIMICLTKKDFGRYKTDQLMLRVSERLLAKPYHDRFIDEVYACVQGKAEYQNMLCWV
jgi:hypothetical protein